MSKELVIVEISEEVAVEVQPDEKHEWLISSEDVAEGYGMSASSLRSVKSRNAHKFHEGTHFVLQTATGTKGDRQKLMWTKAGVLKIGMQGINTPLADAFVDWAVAFIIEKSEETPKAPMIPMTYLEALEAHLDSVKQLESANQVIALQAPKVEAYDDLTHQDKDTINDMTLNEVAKELGYAPRAEFNPMLREAGVIFQKGTEPKSVYVEKGWFRGTPYNNGSYTGMNWKVTPKGYAGMLKKFGRKGDS